MPRAELHGFDLRKGESSVPIAGGEGRRAWTERKKNKFMESGRVHLYPVNACVSKHPCLRERAGAVGCCCDGSGPGELTGGRWFCSSPCTIGFYISLFWSETAAGTCPGISLFGRRDPRGCQLEQTVPNYLADPCHGQTASYRTALVSLNHSHESQAVMMGAQPEFVLEEKVLKKKRIFLARIALSWVSRLQELQFTQSSSLCLRQRPQGYEK
ncbi:hypothetical protein AV530_015557 [Patagioenas fasciata monilis]|uniref:Uncharacterized protein n=1 Tax=Patagioenas fasciata monilis TaxID=372326 RepID=A0A1V4KHX6_PATFA|nr:hypothetical protein AV530_015557 [Patagioenas fasciata monilis]